MDTRGIQTASHMLIISNLMFIVTRSVCVCVERVQKSLIMHEYGFGSCYSVPKARVQHDHGTNLNRYKHVLVIRRGLVIWTKSLRLLCNFVLLAVCIYICDLMSCSLKTIEALLFLQNSGNFGLTGFKASMQRSKGFISPRVVNLPRHKDEQLKQKIEKKKSKLLLHCVI